MEPPGAVEGRRLQTIPSSKSGHHESLFKPKESLSQDNVQLRTIFDRLETINLDLHPQASQTLHSSSSFNDKLNTRCSCGNIESSSLRGHPYRSGTGPGTSTASSDLDSESDDDEEDDDDEPFSLVALIGMMVAQERKGSARQHGAIKNLAASCRSDMLSDSHLHQLVNLTRSSNQQVKQGAFLAMRQAACNEANAETLLQMGIVSQLFTLLQDKMEAASHAAGAAVLEKIVMHKKLADHWLEKMITRGLSILIGCLSSASQAPETKVAFGRLLSNLTCFFEIAVLLLDHCMADVMDMWLRYPVMKESLTDLFSHLVQHTDHTVSGVLENRIMEIVGEALRDETCCVQIKAAGFFLALCGSNYGLSALLDDGKVRVILQVLRATHCRRLRELCMATLTKTLQRATPNQLTELTLQTESAFNEDSAVERKDPGMKSGKDEPGHLGSRKKDVNMRSERGVRILINILVETIHKEAKITFDHRRRIRTIGFRPCVDFFKTLLDTVRCLCYMATMTIGRQRNRTSSHNTKVSIEGSTSKARRLNTNIIQFMFHQGALCVLDLLDTYTNHLFPVARGQNSLQQQRNLDILHLQAMMKVWQMISPPSQNNPPGDEELQFVQQLVECVQLFARCSSELWNNRIEKDVKSKIEKHQSWREEPDHPETTPTRHYQYVKTVDQAFPSILKIENITSHRHEEIEIRERRVNNLQQRRMAWGDKKDLGVEPGISSNHPSLTSLSGNFTNNLPKKTRPSSVKKQGHGSDKFDLSKSVFTEQAKLLSSKHREPVRVQRNMRSAGYTGKAVASVKPDRLQERAIGHEEKELHRKLRTRLFEEGICQTVGPWVACRVPQIQALAAQCLRCIIQPLHPEETRQLRASAEAKERQNRHKSRSEMAKTLAERDKILSQVLGQMSTGSADVVREALRVKGHLEEESTKTSKACKLKTRPPSNPTNNRPTCNSDEPIGWQCSIHLLESSGSHIFKGLRSDSSEVQRACLLFLYDLVAFGEVVVHMKLASLGAVSQLMDFLRKNSQTQDLALIGAMTVRNLMGDYRLKQLFCSEGGESFLNDLIKTSEGALQMNLQQFLKYITEGPGGIL